MRYLIISGAAGAALILTMPAFAGGPLFTGNGGISAPGPNPTYSIDPVTGTGHFKVLDPTAQVGSTTLNAMVSQIAANQSGVQAALPTASLPGAMATAASSMTTAQAASMLVALGAYPSAGLMATNAANGGAVASVLVPQAQKNGERLSTANFGILPGGTSDVFGPARSAMSGGGVLYLPSAGAQGWQAPSYGTPEGMSFEADGPNIAADQLIGHGLGTYTWGKAWAVRLPHNNSQSVTGYSLAASTYGSGYPTNDQTVLAVKAIKDNWNQSNVQSGGLGGIVVSAFNGSPSGTQSDTYALNTYVSVGYASGFAVTSENKINEACQSNGNECFETDFQQGIENSAPGGAHIGEQWSADLGVHTALFRTVGSVAGGDSSSAAFQQTGVTGRWGDLILNQLDGVRNFQLTDTGAIIQASDGTTATQITEANVAGADTWTNGAGTTILQLGQNGALTAGPITATAETVSGPTTTRGVVLAHLAHEVTLAGYNTPQAMVLTTDQANVEGTTDNIMSQLHQPISAYVGISGHVSCTDYNGSAWDGNVVASFRTTAHALPYLLIGQEVQGTPVTVGNGTKWTPSFSVSSLSGATGPKLTIADSGSDTGGIGCTADLSIIEQN